MQVASSGDYRSGFCYVICRVPAGLYTILPSTYRPSAGGSFSLIVGASAAMIRVHALPADGGMQSQVGLGSGVLTARVSRWAFFNGLPPSPPKCPARSHSLGRAHLQVVRGRWDFASGTAVGCNNHGAYDLNPKLMLEVPTDVDAVLLLQVHRRCSLALLSLCCLPLYSSGKSWHLSPSLFLSADNA